MAGTLSKVDHWQGLLEEVEQHERDIRKLRQAEQKSDQRGRKIAKSLGEQEASRCRDKRLRRESLDVLRLDLEDAPRASHDGGFGGGRGRSGGYGYGGRY
jgi:hypothetical protein